MARLVCGVCGEEVVVPVVCCGPGVLSAKDPTKLVCPKDGSTPTDIPKHHGKPMRYVTVPSWAVLSR